MIELTTAAYFTLIGLSILAGYTIHGIVDAIRKGEFFDWNKKAQSIKPWVRRKENIQN